MDNPFSPQDRLVQTSRVGKFVANNDSLVTLPLHETVSIRLAEMPNLNIDEGIHENSRSASTQVSIEVRCTGYSRNSARILGRIQPIPLSDINGRPLDCWVALHGGEADAMQTIPGHPVPQVTSTYMPS